MTKWLASLCACLALGLVAAGCGDDEGEDEGSGAGDTKQEQPADKPAGGGAGGGPKSVEVSMQDIAFQPADVTVARGGTVTWSNDESIGHDVTKESGPGKEFKSGAPGAMQQGDTYKQTFTRAGTIEYVCTVHAPGMAGTVTVK